MSGPRIGGDDDDDDDSFRNRFSYRINIIAVGFHWHVWVRSFIHSFTHSHLPTFVYSGISVIVTTHNLGSHQEWCTCVHCDCGTTGV
jgi:hypothetical protein